MDKWIGKIAVVTGASSGIGAQILVDLAEIGVNVIGLARRKDRVEALANEHKTAKGKIIPMACDVSDPLSIDAVFAQIEKEFGKIHIWINNAGIWRSKKLTDETLCDADIIQTINTNFTGLVLCSRKAVNLMKKSNENGYIININSIAGQLSASMNMAEYGTNVYAGTKHAVTNVTEILRYETSAVNDNKIRFTSISPGVVETEIFSLAGFDQEVLKHFTGLKSKDISDAVMYVLGTPNSVNVSELTIRPTNSIV